MSERMQEDADREKFESLLPFYFTQNLNEADHRFVSHYLASHPQAVQSLDFIQRMSFALKSIGSDRNSVAALDKVLLSYASIKSKSVWRRCLNKLRELGISNAVVIAILVIVAQGVGFIVHLSTDKAHTAKTIDSAVSNNALLTIKSGADAGALIVLIDKFGGRIVNSTVLNGARQIIVSVENKLGIQTLIEFLWGADLIEAAVLLL